MLIDIFKKLLKPFREISKREYKALYEYYLYTIMKKWNYNVFSTRMERIS